MIAAVLAVVAGRAMAGDVVISQIYGAGGASGAPYKNDFVELYNKGAADVSLEGWSLQYASGSSTSAQTSWSSRVSLSGTIKAGRYFLVSLAGGTTGADLPTPDVSSTAINMGTTAGKIALLSTTTQIGTVTCPSADPNIAPYVQDFVGFGTTANCSEGAGAPASNAPAPSITTSVQRLGSPRGAQDTDSNVADFTTGVPDPRNSAFTGAPTVTSVTFDPASVTVPPGGNVVLSVTVSAGFAPIVSVKADLTPVGGSAAAALTYDSVAGKWTLTFNVPPGTPTGTKTINVTATDANGIDGSGSGTLSVNAPGALTVAEARQQPLETTFKVRGIVTATSTGNAYIQDPDSVPNGAGLLIFDGSTVSGVCPLELGQDVTINGRLSTYRGELEFVITSGATPSDPSPDITINSTGNPLPAIKNLTYADIAGNDTYESQLVRFSDLKVVKVPTRINPASTSGSATMTVQDPAGNQFTVYIHRNATDQAVTPYPGPPAAPYHPIIATVDPNDGYFTFPDIKVGDIFTASGPLGDFDTAPFDTIRVRFAEDLVLTGRALITGTSATPTVVERTGVVTLRVVTDPAAGSTVTADLSALGLSASQTLAFNGTDYTYDLVVPANAPLGPISIPVAAANGAVTDKGQISFTILTTKQPMTIAQARASQDFTQVEITGNITSATTGAAKTYQIQDATGGVFLYTTGIDLGANPGDLVTISGYKETYNGTVEINYTYGMWTLGAGTMPASTNTNTAGWAANVGRLVTNPRLYIVAPISGVGTGNYAYTVTDGTAFGELFIHVRAGFLEADLPVVGQSYTVTGIDDYYKAGARDTYQLKPRQPSDVTAGTPPAQIPTQMAWTVQPSNVAPGAAITPAPAVTVKDASGTPVTAFVGPVSVALTAPGTATLAGTTRVNAVGGVATFNGLSVDQAGTYSLTASSQGLANAVSGTFVVSSATPPFAIADVQSALRLASGLQAASAADVTRLDVTADGRVTLADAVAVNRKVNGIGANP
jgi:DNA/RNA endonuclease YhcR with UshA esterase domain